MPTKMGRKKQWAERIQLPLAEGTTAKIDSLLEAGEVRLDFIRTAIDNEMKKRDREKRPKARSGQADRPTSRPDTEKLD